jgi:hypothetical protein
MKKAAGKKEKLRLMEYSLKVNQALINEAEKTERSLAEALLKLGKFSALQEAADWLNGFLEKRWSMVTEETQEGRNQALAEALRYWREVVPEGSEADKELYRRAIMIDPAEARRYRQRLPEIQKELDRLKEEVERLHRRQVGLVWWSGPFIESALAKPGTAATMAEKAKKAGDRALAADFEAWELSGDFGLNKLSVSELRVMGGIFAKMNPGRPGEPLTVTTWADFLRACGALEVDGKQDRSDGQHLHKAFNDLLGKTFKTFATRKNYDKKTKKTTYDLQKFEGTLFSYARVYRDLETGELKKLEEGAITPEEEERLRPEIRIYPQGLLTLVYLKYRRGLPGNLYESIRDRLGPGRYVYPHHLKYALHLARHRGSREVIKTNIYALTNELGLTAYEKSHRRSEAVETIKELSELYLDMGFLAKPVKVTGDSVEERLNPERFPHVKQFKEREARRLEAGEKKPPRKKRKAGKKAKGAPPS